MKDVDLEIGEGEVVLVTGTDGAGKTTFCRCLNGLAQHFFEGVYKGTVFVNGVDVAGSSVTEMAKHVGFLFDNPDTQLLTSTVIDEVAFSLENYGYPVDQIERSIGDSLELVRLKGFEKRIPFTLSGGEKQALALAAVLAVKPKILILDEPTANLDPIGRERILSTIADLAHKENRTIIMVEQKLDEVAALADRLIALDQGKVILADAPRNVLSMDFPKLQALKLKIPQIIQFKQKLESRGLRLSTTPLTVEETWNEIKPLIGRRASAASISRPSENHDRITGKPTNAIVNVQDVWFNYPGTEAERESVLSGISLQVAQGEFLAIIGQNGSGKTTLLKQINGLLKPSKGKVTVDGRDVGKETVARMARIVGYLFQNPDRQIFNPTVLKEVAFAPSSLGIKGPEQDALVKEALELTDLTELKDENPLELSRAERQKVAFASVVVMKPKILIVDEPTTGQDYHSTIEIMDLIKKLNENGSTIIIITHDMEVVAEYVHRVVLMQRGKIILDAPTRAVFSKPEILAESSVRPPPIVRLGQKLREEGMDFTPLTVDEMSDFFLPLVEAK